jgi:trimethylamine---corrinoid protein Co-methyltransferase
MNDIPVKAARAGGRGARRAMRAAPDFEMLSSLKCGLPECEPMTPDQVERIDAASMAILEEVGVIFRDQIALADWKRAGAKVDRILREERDAGPAPVLFWSFESNTRHQGV